MQEMRNIPVQKTIISNMLVKFTVVIYIIFIEIKKSNVKRAKYFN